METKDTNEHLTNGINQTSTPKNPLIVILIMMFMGITACVFAVIYQKSELAFWAVYMPVMLSVVLYNYYKFHPIKVEFENDFFFSKPMLICYSFILAGEVAAIILDIHRTAGMLTIAWACVWLGIYYVCRTPKAPKD